MQAGRAAAVRRAFGAALFAAAVNGAMPAMAEDMEVDLELVLAVDISGSMDYTEHTAQRDGYVEAFRHREVVQAILDGINGRIAVTYVEWAGYGLAATVVPWMVIDGPEAAEAFSAALEVQPINEFRGTSISGGIDFAVTQFDGNGFSGIRRVIDVSGDGPNNSGRPVLEARAEATARGITINGLPIVLGRAGGSLSTSLLDIYYEDCVIGGPGAFMIAVDEIGRLPEAIRRKLVLEIAGTPAGHPARVIPAAMRVAEGRIDCLIGERNRRQWYDDP